jgi:predicted amidohydrolase
MRSNNLQETFRAAAMQMSCEINNKEVNLRKAESLIDKAASQKVNLLVLQELFNLDYVSFTRRDKAVFDYAEPITGETTQRIAERAAKHGMHIVSPIYEKAAPGIYYNTAVLMGPEGKILGKYRKTHIPAIKSLEKLYFRPAAEYPVFKTELGTIGIVICYDRQFPENWRTLTLQGAEVIVAPSATWIKHSWEFLARCRAYENGVFAIVVNRVGKEDEMEYFGNSIIVSPRGEVLAKGGSTDEIVSTEIDLEEVSKTRLEIPFLRDLRPELYGRLTNSSIM